MKAKPRSAAAIRRNILYAVALISALAMGFYYFVIDGRVQPDSSYALDLAELRRLADGPARERPTAVEVEVIARDQIPKMGAQAGIDREPLTLARTVFRLKSPWGDTLIDVGMDRDVAKTFKSGAQFDDAAMARVAGALNRARRIVVTHEHPDHIGFLARFPGIDAIAPNLRLTQEQVRGTAQYTDTGEIPAALLHLRPIASNRHSVVAPGVVAIPSSGHTPGSMMFYVRTQDDRELLFLGDVVWTMSNIVDETGRSRLVQYHLMQTKEDRVRVYQQLRTLISLAKSNPGIVMIPSHDEVHIEKLIETQQIRRGFGPADSASAN